MMGGKGRQYAPFSFTLFLIFQYLHVLLLLSQFKSDYTTPPRLQAASHYQVALTALDRVLRTQVLTLTQHEMTRQRLFLLQQDVFSLR